MDLIQFSNKKVVDKLNRLGNRLNEVKSMIDWKEFDPIIEVIRKNKTALGGRPNKDNILMLKILVLQKWFSLSDEQVEYQILDRVSFQDFLGISYAQVPDFSTVWRFRDHLKEYHLEEDIWNELQRQILMRGFIVEKGHIQDATFTEAQLGKKRYNNEKRARKNGEEIEYTEKQEKHIDRDAKFAIKNNQIHFGYKDHIKMDIDHHFVRSYFITPANIHDNNIDLSEPGDIAMYRDRGYSGRDLRHAQVNDMTMIRRDANKEWVKTWNKAVSKVRVIGERPFSVVKYVFKGGYTFVKNLERVSIGQMFVYFAYNLFNLFTRRSNTT